jgi:hypothetical protein
MKLNRQATRYTTVLMALGIVLLAACDVSRTLMGFRDPVIAVANPAEPVTLTFREGPGGLVLLRGKVNGVVDAEFILDTGAPVTVLLDGPKTKARRQNRHPPSFRRTRFPSHRSETRTLARRV